MPPQALDRNLAVAIARGAIEPRSIRCAADGGAVASAHTARLPGRDCRFTQLARS
jgi:hypothetical protein